MTAAHRSPPATSLEDVARRVVAEMRAYTMFAKPAEARRPEVNVAATGDEAVLVAAALEGRVDPATYRVVGGDFYDHALGFLYELVRAHRERHATVNLATIAKAVAHATGGDEDDELARLESFINDTPFVFYIDAVAERVRDAALVRAALSDIARADAAARVGPFDPAAVLAALEGAASRLREGFETNVRS